MELQGPLHTRDRDPVIINYTSSTLIGGKLEGPTKYVNARWNLKSTWLPTYMASNGSCFMITWILFNKPPLGGKPNTKLGNHGTLNTCNPLVYFFLITCEDPHE